MLLAAGSVLVAGSAASAMATQYIRVTRAFFIGGTVQAIGTVIEVPTHLAAGWIAAGKAVAAPKPAPEPVPVVVQDEPQPAPVDVPPEPRRRGKGHVGK